MTTKLTFTALIAALALPLAFGSFASAGAAIGKKEEAKPDPRRGEKVDKICFNRNIDGFSNATRRSVVLETSPSRKYLVEVNGSCFKLRHAQSIGIDSSLSCVRRNDILIVSDSAFSLRGSTGIGPDRCFIDAIYKWNEDAIEDSEEDTDTESGETVDTEI